jgi:CDP-6-deoxy-D-xylo-4-hexulose-3-dehydrase
MDATMNLPPYVPNQKEFIPGVTPVLYSGPYWDHREIEMATQALLTGQWLAAGEYVARFQNIFAQRFETKYAHMVNSGSSANLVTLAALKKYFNWKDDNEIIVSPVGFPTTIASIVQNNLKPVFVDIEMDTLNFDISKVWQNIHGSTVGIFVSPVLGNPPDMESLRRMRDDRDVILIGDNCDSLGTKWDEHLLNDYYFAWTSSFYAAHHITTGEGGMICSNNAEFIKIARSISWWGKDCYCVGKANSLPKGTCGTRFKKWIPELDVVMDHKYVFTHMGYNLKPLDLQGAIGIAQMEKFDEIETKRRDHKNRIAKFFEGKEHVKVVDHLPQADPCWFGVPLLCDSAEEKERLQEYLESNKIQTRSYFAGNILAHPGYSYLDDALHFPNANKALKLVLFIGCAPHYTDEIIRYIGEVVGKWN